MASGNIGPVVGSGLPEVHNLAILNFLNHDTKSEIFNTQFYFSNYYNIKLRKNSDDQLVIQLGGCPWNFKDIRIPEYEPSFGGFQDGLVPCTPRYP